jgi:hypothetical protein
MYLYGLSLFTLTNIGLVTNFSIVTNNTMLFSNAYCIMYGPNHFLLTSLGVTYFPLETIEHNHQN